MTYMFISFNPTRVLLGNKVSRILLNKKDIPMHNYNKNVNAALAVYLSYTRLRSS